MSSTLTIAIAVAAVLAVVLLIAFRKKPELPRDSAADRVLRAPSERPAAVRDTASTKRIGRDASDATRPIDVESDVLPTPPPPPPKATDGALGRTQPSAEDVATLKKGLASTRGGFVARLSQLFRGKKEIEPGLLDEIEEVLITADIGVGTTQRILDRLRYRMSRRELTDEERVWAAIREEASAILEHSGTGMSINHRPAVILVVGVNGVGKTTTTGKLASRLSTQGKKVVLAAA
ncbi:MAG: Signal recognition particle receptor protein FtsY, partial [Myxococcaceae bacterium]|nr:Signal recognition particle receptor protein FtsY [Myxococcaceae bacterium]